MAGMTESAVGSLALGESLYPFELDLDHRHKHHLRDAVTDPYFERLLPPIPAGHKHLPLIIRIDQADQIAEHNAMFVPQTRARQQDRRQASVIDMNRQPGGDQVRFTRLKGKRLIETGTKIQAGRARGRVLRQGNVLAQSVIKNLQLDVVHGTGLQ